MAYSVPDLPYDYNALEPHIDEATMRVHHDKHHGTYVTNVNKALEGTEWADKPIEEVIKNLSQIPDDKRTAVRNNGGGHLNHSIFWAIMGPNAGGEPTGEISEAINQAFGDFATFKDTLSKAAIGQFGSGWGWAYLAGGRLAVKGFPNQDNPVMEGGVPILGVDVWEHAYYLKYQNKRPDYVAAWWNTVNWEAVNERLRAAR